MTIRTPMRSVAPDAKHPIRFPKMASPKLDGIRFVNMDGLCITKSGKPIPNLFVQEWAEKYLPVGCDGELIVGEPNLETTYNTTFRGVMTIKGEPDFRFHLFDRVEDSVVAWERYTALSRLELNDRIVLVKQRWVNNQAELDAFYEGCLSDGYEGVILKEPTGSYKFGRSTAKEQTQLKLKPEHDEDALVLAFDEAMHNGNEAFLNALGETDRSAHQDNKTGLGMVGGIQVVNQHGLKFNVSPGKLTHDERRSVWANKESYIGKFLKYRSMSYGVKEAPRHPRFLCWRDASDIDWSSKND